ncbi:MAG: AAA family ATPase [Bacilli bacterium]|nr:AAA family ATPase [Bacilli bacterium]
MEGKRVSLGIEDFKEIKKECYYVDKTLFLKDIIDSPVSSFFLITRPRRFGKSVAASMVQTFFERDDTDETDYFSDCLIAKEDPKYRDYQRNFPVVSLSFKNLPSGSYEDIRQAIRDIFFEEYARHYPISREEFDLLKDMDLIYDLTKRLSLDNNKKTIVIIDEYDAPIQSVKEGDYDSIISFLKGMYGKAFKGNPYLQYAVVFGILKLGKESLFSGLNNALIDTITAPLFAKEHFALTKQEVGKMLDYFGMADQLPTVEEYYGGYRFDEGSCFNPWSTFSFIRRFGRVDAYWSNTTNVSLIRKAAIDAFSSDASALLSGQKISIKISNASSYDNVMSNKNFFFEFLLYAGYLTISSDLGMSSYAVCIPNKEIASIFSGEILDVIGSSLDTILVRDAFLTGDAEAVEDYLKRVVSTSFSYFEFSDWRNYQILLLSLTAVLFNDYLVKSEENASLGRADIILYPKKEGAPGLLIEVKSHDADLSKSKLQNSAKAALRQIIKQDYASRLNERGVTSILAYGISFFKNKVYVVNEML